MKQESKSMKNQILQYYMHDGPSAFRFELSGELTNEGARRLEQDWRTASSVIGGRTLVVDLTFATRVDEAGRNLLARWHGEGAQLIAASKSSRILAETIVGGPLPDFAAMDKSGAGRTWMPFPSVFAGASTLLLIAALLLPIRAEAANLKPETAAAWDEYVQSTRAALKDQVHADGGFLRIYESPEGMTKVHNGEVVATPVAGESPKKVPGGLIHHWRGAAFISNAKLDDVLDVIRDYDRYREYYQPSVRESRSVARDGADDRFSMLLLNKAFFMKTALDADYEATNVRVDGHRFYTVSNTTRLQEVESYGQAEQHKLPQGEGTGYIWKLFSVTRLDERDGGVYVEMETAALSREIPGAMRVVVDPIVKRVSRNSMVLSVRQTADAARVHCTAAASSGAPVNAERTSGGPILRSSSSGFVKVQ
jgi:hypothetical protein